jgi:hypothetical protein
MLKTISRDGLLYNKRISYEAGSQTLQPNHLLQLSMVQSFYRLDESLHVIQA